MEQNQGNLSGHAGLFSTAEDMSKLSKGLINRTILDDKYIEMIAQNRTGKKYVEDGVENYIQYLGFLCYSKNPNAYSTEVYHALSGRSFASAGWTGPQLTVDPINEVYLFMGANRSHNRATFIDSAWNDKINIDEHGKKTIFYDGKNVIDSTKFAWDRNDYVLYPVLKLTLQYKMLEDIMHYEKEKEDVIIKHI